jgi:hypothetical protein
MEGGEGEEGVDPSHRIIRNPDTGREWIVRVTGHSASGILPLRSIPIVELTFSSVEEPERAQYQVVTYDRTLEDTSDQDLITLLQSSRPFEPPFRNRGPSDRRKRPRRHRRGSPS